MSEQVQDELVQSENQAPVEQPKTVSWEDHQRALADLHKFKQRAAKIETEQKQAKEAELRQREQWKQLAEQKEIEAKAAAEKAASLERSYINEKKFGSLKDEAVKLGLRAEAVADLELVDLDDLVQIETTSTGKINVLGAKTAAERLKTLRPHWFQQAAATINGSTPRITAEVGPVTAKDVYAAEVAARKSGKPEDMQRYQELHLKFRKQGRG